MSPRMVIRGGGAIGGPLASCHVIARPCALWLARTATTGSRGEERRAILPRLRSHTYLVPLLPSLLLAHASKEGKATSGCCGCKDGQVNSEGERRKHAK
ncbi:hypothetical protein DAEQUDRAFT_200398 [Daedalea quercina L-15889]|uniref:Uncharacterized protein n=1 Tax=Daedalea quercina L-15889 TaxID=1314783 RepID=A0A165U9A1_9APHY|nr:hypothetical protein DAEQUDRAFT_200398 [Daedalea quercina L-15889]